MAKSFDPIKKEIEIDKNKEIEEIEFFTDGPEVKEEIKGKYKKLITVTADYHFENVTTYTSITEAKKDSIKVYWIKGNKKELFTDVEYIDTNSNGLIDKLQWIIPHLSEQTFEISISILNPVEYLKDGDTWTVIFNTTGEADLIINSTNAQWTELLMDNENTFDEMQFLDLKCGDNSLKDSLIVQADNGLEYDYKDINPSSFLKPIKFIVYNYSCEDLGYFSNYMHKAGYATLMFTYSNENMTITDYAYDPETNVTTPNIIPSSPTTTDTLTCNFTAFNSTNNITNWYVNNVSLIDVLMTFETDPFSYDTGNNMTDYSGNGHHGSLSGAGASPIWNPTGGIIGGAYNFPGGGSNEKVIVASGSQPPSQVGTIEAWVYPETYPGIVDVLADPGTGSGDFRFYVNSGGNSLYGFFISQERRVSTSEYPATGTWTFITLTWNGSGTYLYFNGSFIGKNTVGAVPAFTGNGLQIGGNINSGDWNWDGYIDEVRVYNRSLPQPEIKQHYNLNYHILNASETNTNEEWFCSVTPHDGRSAGDNKNSSSVIIQTTDTSPSISSVAIKPNSATTATNLDCNATITDPDNATVTVEYWWYNSSNFVAGGNTTGITIDTNYKISTLGYENTSDGETWNCTIRAYDGTDYSSKDSDKITISSGPGNSLSNFTSDPIISPTSPTTNDSLTCQYSVEDTNGDPVVNITNWFVDDESLTLLYLPFEGGTNSTYAKDYSGFGYDASSTSSGTDPIWNSSFGYYGNSIELKGGKYYTTSQTLPSYNGSVSLWVYPIYDPVGDNDIIGAGVGGDDFRMLLGGSGSNYYGFYMDSTDYRVLTGSEPAMNQWTLLTLTWNNSGMYLYFNATKIGSQTSNGGPQLFDRSGLDIGGFGTQSTKWYGYIDELRLFNRTLSESQIKTMYETGSFDKINHTETKLNEQWYCEVTLNDGNEDGEYMKSSSVTISTPVTQNFDFSDDPVITPANPLTSQELICNFNTTKSGINITNWYLNNESITKLLLPFEADGSNNMSDYSGNNNDGSPGGSGMEIVWKPNGGIKGGAFDFNNAGVISTNQQPPSQEGTVEMWVYPETYHGILDIAGDSGTGSGDFRWYINTGSSNLYGFWIGGEYRVSTSEEPPLNQWTLVTLTWNSSGTYLYFNGTFIQKKTPGPPAFSGSGLDIGGNSGSGDQNFNGTIDEVRVYNRSLSQAEIIQHFNLDYHKLNGNETNPNEEWHCEVTLNNGTTDVASKNSTGVIIQPPDTSPSITDVVIKPDGANSTKDLDCNATISDPDNSTVTVEYWWYNSSNFVAGGNTTGITIDTNYKISTLGYENTSDGETWNCTIRAYDGTDYSSKDSDTIKITSCTNPYDNFYINRNVTLCYNSEYEISDNGAEGVLIVNTSNIVIDCNNTLINGTGSYSGYGIFNDGHDNVTIKNCKIQGYYSALYFSNSSGNTIQYNNFMHNRIRTSSGDGGDFLSVWGGATNTDDNGGGIFFWKVNNTLVIHNNISKQQNGIQLFESHHNDILNNNASYVEGWGIHLYNSSYNLVKNNTANDAYDKDSDYCINVQNNGCDAAGLLILRDSNNNTITYNKLKRGGDGYFGAGVNSDAGWFGTDRNYVAHNDMSYGWHHCIEHTFSRHNIFEYNNLSHCIRAGLWLGFSQNTTVQYNTIYNASGAGNYGGINTDRGINNTYRYNNITDSNYAGIYLYNGGYDASTGVDDSFYNTINYNRIINISETGIRFNNNTDSLISNNILIENYYGIYLILENNNNLFKENTIYIASDDSWGVIIQSSYNSTFKGNNITTVAAPDNAYRIDGSDNIKIYDDILNVPASVKDIDITGDSDNIWVINTSLDEDDIGADATSSIYIGYYLSINVTGNTGPANNANATGWQNDGSEAFSNLTDAQGQIEKIELIQFRVTNNVYNYTDYSNYTINITFNGDTQSQKLNMSTNRILNYDFASQLSITWVQSLSALPNESTSRTVWIAFNATDIDGLSNLNDSTAKIELSLPGEIQRNSTSCSATDGTNSRMYNCSIYMQYYDKDGSWTINATIKDKSDESAHNDSETFRYGKLYSVRGNKDGITFSSVSLGETRNGSNDPLLLDNTGNQNFTEIKITAYDLRGKTTTYQYVPAENLYVNTTKDALGETLVNASSITITNAALTRDINAQDQNISIYVWVRTPSVDLSAQEYVSSNPWRIRLFE